VAANTEAVAHCRRTRTGSVSSPRRSWNASSGESDPPVSILVARICEIRSSEPVTTPPVVSEWPPMYLVAECTTRSAPCSSGRQITGGARVESITSSAPRSCAISASCLMSATAVVGFAIVSAKMIRVAGPTAERTASRSVMSTKSVSTPNRVSTFRSRL
jgi:hypothetical protein